ncbi:hypothetical protein [Roseospira marina]|uniref:hypothetical protein n=1 Tax=Roseospira marina TaxID=140057 RepID=UPI0014791E33|nr:hypothetical protein [Roseospira marina]MBB4312660.1 hypothetical protein [Roseospira marina]MBB5086567.1 hypothetical protein [Roseospira marina]
MRKAGVFIHDRAGEAPRPIAPKGATPAPRPARLPAPATPAAPPEDAGAKRPTKKKEA